MEVASVPWPYGHGWGCAGLWPDLVKEIVVNDLAAAGGLKRGGAEGAEGKGAIIRHALFRAAIQGRCDHGSSSVIASSRLW